MERAMNQPRATARQTSTVQAAINVGEALRRSSFEKPVTMCDLARTIAGVGNGEWEAMQAGQRKWYWRRAQSIINSLNFVAGLPIAEDERGGITVYFLLEPP